MKGDLKISGYSTALYSTFWFIEPLNLLLDCGDGAAATLQQKGRKVKTIACSHADRDHLTGLFRFLEVNCSKGSKRVLFPKDCGSFPAIEDFTNRFDPHVAGNSVWQGICDGDSIRIKPNVFLEAFGNRHVSVANEEADGAHKSLSFAVIRETKKLRPEFADLAGVEIGKLRAQLSEDKMFASERTNVLTYSADTPIEEASFWRNPKILIHEATFLDAETATSRGQDSRHSVLGDVLAMAAEMESLEALILGHFSTRYSEGQIRDAIVADAQRLGIKIPVFAVFPSEFVPDILSTEPVWAG